MNIEFFSIFPTCPLPFQIVSTKPIARGEQILLHYGYPIANGSDGRGGIPDWYEKLYEAEIGPIPREGEESVFFDFNAP